MTQQDFSAASQKLPAGFVARFPTTQSQQRFWILEQISPGNSSANVALRWEIVGRVQREHVERAYCEVIARHEILRTCFSEEDGLPVQDVVEGCDFKLSVIDLRHVPPELLEQRIASICHAEASTPFDLTVPGLIRGTLLQLAADRSYILTTVHHMCFDGFSIRLLGREIGEIIAGLQESRAAALPDLQLQYGDFALWQQAYLASSDFEAEEKYWRGQLAGRRYFEFPTDHPRGAERSYAGTIVSRLLSPAISARIDATARAHSVSTFSLSAAILSAVLQRMTGSGEVSLGTQVAGRDDIMLEDLIGVFINNLVLAIDVDPQAPFADHLAAVNGVVRGALEHQRMPFNKLVEIINPPRNPARTPLMSVNMIVQKAFLEDHAYGSFELLGRPSATPGSLFDLNFMMIGRPEGWRASLEFNPDLYSKETADALLQAWCTAIDRLTADVGLSPSDLDVPQRDAPKRLGEAAAIDAAMAGLTGHPAVAAAAVAREADGRLLAHVVPTTDTSLALETLPTLLQAHLAGRLPAEAVPQTIRIVMRLPGDERRAAAPAPSPAEAEELDAVAAMEGKIAALWRDLLGIESISPTANFFDLGGHSLLAVRMIARLREILKVEINTGIVYQTPTIAGLAPQLVQIANRKAAASARSVAADNRIVVTNPDALGIPVIAINNYSTIYSVAKHFADKRRLITVRLADPDAAFSLPKQTFEEIADAYVGLVKQVQPAGPYALFGVCVHGNVALEVARRLIAKGDEVVGVFMKDVWAPAYSAHVKNNGGIRRANKLHDLRVRLRKWKRGEMSVFDILRYYPRVRRSWIFNAVERFVGAHGGLETQLLQTTSQGDFIRHLSSARNAYTPAPYPGRVVMFATGEAPSGAMFDRSLGWKDVITGPFEIREIDEIVVFRGLELGTREVADSIDLVLRQAEAR